MSKRISSCRLFLLLLLGGLLLAVDNVEGWHKWDAAGGWVRTDDGSLNPRLAWQADAPGAVLTLAGALDLREAVSPTLTFWYTMTTGGEGIVEVSTDGTAWQPAATITPTTEWTQASADLSAWAGLPATLRLRQTAGVTWAVDDFAVRDVVPPVVHPLPFSDDMEAPTANWRAVNAWQPVTETAHSGEVAWRGYSGDSALILVGRPDLTESVSPTFSFWQRFALPEGSMGYVKVSANGGLTWRPVLTVTEPISDWMQTTVDLSAYVGKQVGLAFYLETVAAGGMAQIERPEPVAVTSNTDCSAQTPPSSIPMLPIAFPTALGGIGLVVSKRQRRQWLVLGILAGVGLGGVLSACCCGWVSDERRYELINKLDDVMGEVDLVMGAEREPTFAYLSPDGKWMLVELDHRDPYWISRHQGSGIEWVLIDLVNNVEHPLTLRSFTARWLRDDLFALAFPHYLVHVPDLKITPLERREGLETLEGASMIYALPDLGGGGTTLVTDDPSYPYWVPIGSELGTWLDSVPSQIVCADKGPDPKAKTYSPDERYYVKAGEIYDAQTDELVAYADKQVWVGSVLGWAYDSSGVYIRYSGGSVDESAANPESPIYKLLVPGATPRGTPVPVSTPTPASEGRIPGTAQLRLVAYRPAPVAQSGEQGWYVDDVSVFDAASSLYIFADDFDRPDSSDLGPDWVEEAGDWNIVSGQLHYPVTQSGCRVVTVESFDDTAFVIETRLRATGNFTNPPTGSDPTGG